MSVSASLDLLVISLITKRQITPTRAIDVLLKNGWNLGRDGYVAYSPLGCSSDPYEVVVKKVSEQLLMVELHEKEKCSELINVTMFWGDTEVDIHILLWDEKSAQEQKITTPIVLNMGERTKFLTSSSYEITDVNWYLERILPAFAKDDMYIECFTYEEHR